MKITDRITALEKASGAHSIATWWDEDDDQMLAGVVDAYRAGIPSSKGICCIIGATGEMIRIAAGENTWKRPPRSGPSRPKPKELATRGYSFVLVPEKDEPDEGDGKDVTLMAELLAGRP